MMVPSKRIRLDFDDDTPIMFSYAELAKRHESRAETHPAPLTMATEEDAFFKSLLERASQYDVGTAGEDVDSGDEDNAPKDGKANEGDEYDYEDPFIDDSDLLLDHPYDYAELEFDGYFAYRGVLEGTEVPEELLEPEPTPKRRSTASNRSKPSASSSNTNGVSKAKSTTSAQKAKPNDTTSSASASDAKGKKPAMKKSTSASTSTAASSSSVHDETNKEADDAIKAANAANDGHVVLTPIDASLLPLFDKLRELRKSETFEVKAKFPVSMRPCVIEIGVKMFRLYKQVDENILRHLMEILPYNRFTLKVIRFPFSLDPTEKLILFDKKYLITKAGPLNITEAQEEIERLIPVLAKNVEEAMPEQVNAYHQKLEEQKLEEASKVSTDEGDSVKVERKFKWNDKTRKTLQEILYCDLFWTHLQSEIGQLSHKATEQVSEIKERRQLYAKLQKCWPDNWMTTYELSRQYSAYKARLKNSEQWAAAAVSASSSSPAANAKKPANAGVKRTASSSSISSGTKPPNKHTSNSSPVMEKKLKLAHEASSPSPIVIPSDDESTTLRATGDGNIPVSSAPAPGPSSAVPTIGNAKPASMNIASLISGS